jgi:cytidylate kinase
MIKTKLLDPSARLIVAIDGQAGSGKGTIAKLLASKFNLTHCETSLFYRRLALQVLNISKTMNKQEIIALSSQTLQISSSPELYSPEVTEMASIIAAIPEVRENLNKPQKDFIANHNRVVMEGRGIATIIAPNADLKLFITADINTRATRRYQQIQRAVSLEQVKSDLEARDLRDSSRETAPLEKTIDAIEIDTTSQTPEEIIEKILEL